MFYHKSLKRYTHIYIYVNIYIYIYTYIYTHTHTHIHTRQHTYTHTVLPGVQYGCHLVRSSYLKSYKQYFDFLLNYKIRESYYFKRKKKKISK